MSRAGRVVHLEADVDELLSEPWRIDLLRAVAELEQAAGQFLSRTELEAAAAIAAAGIAFCCKEDVCASPRRSGIPEERYIAVREVVLRGGPSLTNSDPEYQALRGCEVLYAIMPVVDGDGRPQRVLTRDIDGCTDGWSLLAPLHGPEDEAFDDSAFTSPIDGSFWFRPPTLEVLLAFADEARRLVAELAREMRHKAEEIVEEAALLEQLAAVA